MKKYAILIAILILFLARVTIADEDYDKEVYESTVKKIELMIGEFDKKETYKDVKIDDKKFEDLPEEIQIIFISLNGESLSKALKNLEISWQYDYKKLKYSMEKKEKKEKEKEGESETETIENKKPTPEEIEEYIKSLHEMRIKHAKNLESFIEKMKETNIPEEDAKFLAKRIKDFNDKEMLIQRNSDGN